MKKLINTLLLLCLLLTLPVLARAEEAMQMALDEVRQSRVRFRAASNEQMQQIRSGSASVPEEKPEDSEEKVEN